MTSAQVICLKIFPLFEKHFTFSGTFYLFAAVLFLSIPVKSCSCLLEKKLWHYVKNPNVTIPKTRKNPEHIHKSRNPDWS
jgi:hypothetical protein